MFRVLQRVGVRRAAMAEAGSFFLSCRCAAVLACLQRARSTDSRHVHLLQRLATLYAVCLALAKFRECELAVCNTLGTTGPKESRSARARGLPPRQDTRRNFLSNPSGEAPLLRIMGKESIPSHLASKAGPRGSQKAAPRRQGSSNGPCHLQPRGRAAICGPANERGPHGQRQPIEDERG